MRVKTRDIKLTNEEDAREFLNKIFIGTASNLAYYKPSPESSQVIFCEVCQGLLRFGSATLREMRTVEDPDDVSYALDVKSDEKQVDLPTNVCEILIVIQNFITPIFEEIAKTNIDRAMKKMYHTHELKIEW